MNDQEAKDIVAMWSTYFNEHMAETTRANWMKELQHPNIHYHTAAKIIRLMSEMDFGSKIPTFGDFLKHYKTTIKEKHNERVEQRSNVISQTCNTCLGRVYMGLVLCGDQMEKTPCYHINDVAGIAKAYWVHSIPCPDCPEGREATLQKHPRWMRNEGDWISIFRKHAIPLNRANWKAEEMNARAEHAYFGRPLPAHMLPGYVPDPDQLAMRAKIAAVIRREFADTPMVEVLQESTL